MSKIIKLTEADLRRIITENLEGGVSEGDGIFGMLAKKAASAAAALTSSPKPKGFSTASGVKTGYVRIASTMRREVVDLLVKSPTIKISPKTFKVLDEPRYNVRVAYDQINELATEGLQGSIRGELMTIDAALGRVKGELMKPPGQVLNIKKMMEDLYMVKDELVQDLLKRPGMIKDVTTLQKPLSKVVATINHIETLFKTPDKPTSYLVKEEPKL